MKQSDVSGWELVLGIAFLFALFLVCLREFFS
jgi:hypothetical protein